MARRPQDVTDAELEVLRALWDDGPGDDPHARRPALPRRRHLRVRHGAEAARAARGQGPRARRAEGRQNVYSARVQREDLVARRLRDTAEQLCDGSLTPLLTHLVSAGAALARRAPGAAPARRPAVAEGLSHGRPRSASCSRTPPPPACSRSSPGPPRASCAARPWSTACGSSRSCKLVTPPLAPLPLLPAWPRPRRSRSAGADPIVVRHPAPRDAGRGPRSLARRRRRARGRAAAPLPAPVAIRSSPRPRRPAPAARPIARRRRPRAGERPRGCRSRPGALAIALLDGLALRALPPPARLRAEPAPAAIAERAAALAAALGLRRVPPVLLVPARIPPMLWPHRGGPRLLLPARPAPRAARRRARRAPRARARPRAPPRPLGAPRGARRDRALLVVPGHLVGAARAAPRRGALLRRVGAARAAALRRGLRERPAQEPDVRRRRRRARCRRSPPAPARSTTSKPD